MPIYWNTLLDSSASKYENASQPTGLLLIHRSTQPERALIPTIAKQSVAERLADQQRAVLLWTSLQKPMVGISAL